LTENVPDFRRLEAEALARDVVALEAYIQNEPEPTGAVFLKPADA